LGKTIAVYPLYCLAPANAGTYRKAALKCVRVKQ